MADTFSLVSDSLMMLRGYDAYTGTKELLRLLGIGSMV
jgi:hypothetical protein